MRKRKEEGVRRCAIENENPPSGSGGKNMKKNIEIIGNSDAKRGRRKNRENIGLGNCLGSILEAIGVAFGRSWALLGVSWALLGAS